MNHRSRQVGIVLGALLLAVLLSLPALAAGKQSFTGTVTDAMCGATHMMDGDAAACLHACVKQGSKYALVVGDKVYNLTTSDKAVLATLDKLANDQAKVTGTAKGNTIEVSSVAVAK